jgi:hypothetical protein
MSITRFAIVSLAALLVAAPAFSEETLKATVPFDFTVGTSRMRAGDYLVLFDANYIRLARDDRKASAILLTLPVQARRPSDGGKLIFNKYGDSYFLSEIWSAGYEQGHLLRKSREELEVAKNGGDVRQSTIAARLSKPRHMGRMRP